MFSLILYIFYYFQFFFFSCISKVCHWNLNDVGHLWMMIQVNVFTSYIVSVWPTSLNNLINGHLLLIWTIYTDIVFIYFIWFFFVFWREFVICTYSCYSCLYLIHFFMSFVSFLISAFIFFPLLWFLSLSLK